MRVCRILPPPCAWASCWPTVNCAMRMSRGSSTTRMHTWRAKRPWPSTMRRSKRAYPALAAKLDGAPINDEPLVERIINAHYRLGTAANAKALAQYATRNGANSTMRAEALMQLGLWGVTPQRDRIVGIYRPLKAVATPRHAADALMPVLPKVLGQGPEVVQLAALEAIGNLSAARRSRRRSSRPWPTTRRREAVRVGALKALDTFGGDDVMTRHRRRREIQRLRAAPRRAADRRAPLRPNARCPSSGACLPARFGSRAAGRVPGHGAAQDRGDAQAAGRPRSTSSPRARFSRARSSS